MIKRKLALGLLVSIISTSLSLTSYAAWEGGPGHWKWRNSDGSYLRGGIATINGVMYDFDKNGILTENQWVQMLSGKWRYCLDGGAVAVSQWIDGTYYVDSDGLMMTDAWTPDGYYVGADGKWSPGAAQSTSTTVYNYYSTYDSTAAGYFQTHDPQSGLKHLTIEQTGNEIIIRERGTKYTLERQEGSTKTYKTPIMAGGMVEDMYLWIDESQGICAYTEDPYDIRLDYFILSTRSPSEYMTTTEDVRLRTSAVISKDEAKRIAEKYWGITSGQRDADTGFEMFVTDPEYVVDRQTKKGYYRAVLRWFVEERGGGHASTIDKIYIDPETKKVFEKLDGMW